MRRERVSSRSGVGSRFKSTGFAQDCLDLAWIPCSPTQVSVAPVRSGMYRAS